MLKRKLVRYLFPRKHFEDGTKSDPTVKTFGYTQSFPQFPICTYFLNSSECEPSR